jgi:hypothetical protein
MGMSNLIAFFIILTTAQTLHQRGITGIQTSAQAAQALGPVVGSLAFVVFSLGVIGTGLLAVPVPAGSTAYAASETCDWDKGLEKPFAEAASFYTVIIVSMVIAVGVLFSPLDPIKALFWSAVINGIIAVPILGAMMIVASRRDEMGVFVATPAQRILDGLRHWSWPAPSRECSSFDTPSWSGTARHGDHSCCDICRCFRGPHGQASAAHNCRARDVRCFRCAHPTGRNVAIVIARIAMNRMGPQ